MKPKLRPSIFRNAAKSLFDEYENGVEIVFSCWHIQRAAGQFFDHQCPERVFYEKMFDCEKSCFLDKLTDGKRPTERKIRDFQLLALLLAAEMCE